MKTFSAVLCIILIIAIPFGSILLTDALSIKMLFLGDANLDYDVNVKDATAVQKHAAYIEVLSGDAARCANVNGDTEVNVKDATVIQKYSALLPVDYPVGKELYDPEPTHTAPGTAIPTASTQTQHTSTQPPMTATAATEPTQQVPKPNKNITIYFSNNAGWQTVNAYLYNYTTKISRKAWPGSPMEYVTTNEFGEKIYKTDVNVSEFDRVVFNNGTSQSINAALSVASSGFYLSSTTPKAAMQLGVYTYDEKTAGKVTKTTLKYPTGYSKPIEIWTPAGYDATAKTDKYSVIYLLDGQNQFDDTDPYNGGWGSDETVATLIRNGGGKYILVGIDNSNNRDSELTPNIGKVAAGYESGFSNGTGKVFSDFVADTVMPYVESNFNVFTDAAHTAVIGSSSGGIEAFYLGLEHHDKFGMIGAFSPAFMLFDKSVWDSYLSKYDFGAKDMPRIYFYNGKGDSLENELYPYANQMPDWLINKGYSADKLTFICEDKNAHNEAAWRVVLPECISWLYEL